jgi:hypothetical protein
MTKWERSFQRGRRPSNCKWALLIGCCKTLTYEGFDNAVCSLALVVVCKRACHRSVLSLDRGLRSKEISRPVLGWRTQRLCYWRACNVLGNRPCGNSRLRWKMGGRPRGSEKLVRICLKTGIDRKLTGGKALCEMRVGFGIAQMRTRWDCSLEGNGRS